MKILLQNYSTPLSTESLYLHKAMVEGGCDALFWADQNISAFDMFDSAQPNVFLTHFAYLSNDMLKYLTGSIIEVVLNVTGANPEVIKQIEGEFKSRKIKTPLFFTNTHELIMPSPGNETKLINIMPGLDVFIPVHEVPDFNVDKCFVTTGTRESLNEIINDEESYHTICLGNAKEEGFDFNLELPSLLSLVDKYNKCVIVDDINIVFSQLFFDVTFRSNGTNLIVPQAQNGTLNKVLELSLIHI